jgi:hypothetical protein
LLRHRNEGPRCRARAKKCPPVVGSPLLTPEEDERLRKLALTGISVAAMAKQMHRRMAAVRNRDARNQGLGLKAKGR